MKSLLLSLLMLSLNLPVSLTAQVVARQGDPEKSSSRDFKSPMVLDLPIQDFKTLDSGTGKDFKEVRQYYCEDVAISRLLVTKRGDSRRGKPSEVKLEIRGSIAVRPSYDRLARLRFEIVKGSESFAITQTSEIDAEEGRTHKFATTLRLKSEAFDRLLEEGEPPLLRVTVMVQDNR